MGERRKCKICGTKDYELDHTRTVLEEKMFSKVKIKLGPKK